MSATSKTVVGGDGSVLLPADVRHRRSVTPGTRLTVVDDADGVLLLTRNQLRDRVRNELADLDLVGELIVERRFMAVAEHG